MLEQPNTNQAGPAGAMPRRTFCAMALATAACLSCGGGGGAAAVAPPHPVKPVVIELRLMAVQGAGADGGLELPRQIVQFAADA